MRGRRWWVVGIAAVLVLAVGVGVVIELHAKGSARRRDAAAAAARFLDAWQHQRYDSLDQLATGSPAALFRGTDQRLKVTSATLRPGRLAKDGVTVPFDATLQLAAIGPWTYTGSLTVAETPSGWRVAATPASYHPALRDGQQLERRRTQPHRGDVLDRNGRSLRALSPDLAANVLGTVGAAPADTDRVLKGEPTGLTGLERALDDKLGGRSGGSVVVAAAGTDVSTLLSVPGAPGSDVRTTLDADQQAAAEKALTGLPARAALVAVDAPTGEVRAVANSPVSGLPAAFTAAAPGSTFKIVTATAALQSGANSTTPVDCPATVGVGGRTFQNEEGLGALGSIPLSKAFAVSCNTAFINLSRTLPDGALLAAAKLYGFGRTDLLPIRTDGGTIPPPSSPVEAAADAIGQGKVEVSPLLLATVSAAVADGTWRQPKLLPGDGTTTPLPAGVVDPLRQLMRGVVTGGTGTAANLPGTPVYGKTGTAEYGTADPPLTHAWFTGFRGSLAFAVYVETGSSGGAVAAPAAARFLRAVPG